MDKINYRFLNYKHYSSFKNALDNNRIKDDSIVFIQDKESIWARGKEYVFGGSYTSEAEGNTLTFKNGKDTALFTITLGNGAISFTDANGNTISATYILKSLYDSFVESLSDVTHNGDLKTVAFTGSYEDLTSKPSIPIVDGELDANSTHAIQNKVVAEELLNKATKLQLNEYATTNDLKTKADKLELSGLVSSGDLTTLLANKQNVLTAGDGIIIDNNVISANLDIDTTVYEIVNELPTSNINNNKIYLVKTETETEGEFIYIQWKHDAQEGWVLLGQAGPTVDLTDYITRNEASLTFAPKAAANNPYIVQSALNNVIAGLSDFYQAKGNYITQEYADLTYQYKGNYLTQASLSDYLTSTDIANAYASIQSVNNIKSTIENWVIANYVNKADVYTDGDGNITITPTPTPSPSTGTGGGSTVTIDVDSELSISSSNPVENRVIYNALRDKADKSLLLDLATKLELADKADKSQLSGYATTTALAQGLALKQDTLSEGYGINISDEGEISVTLDTDLFVIVSQLPDFNINENKIYLLEQENDGEVTYTEYRRRNNTWVEVGSKDIEIDLSDYYTKTLADNRYLIPNGTFLTPTEANQLYQPKGNDYALASEVARDYQLKGNYVTTTDFEAMRLNINSVFLRKGDYALAADVTAALTTLQALIDSKYVLKEDVYNTEGDDWTVTTPSEIIIPGSSGSGSSSGGNSGSGGSSSNMVTLTVQQYEAMVRSNLVDPNTYYFTYEQEESETWTFGGTFPITLTDGSTSNDMGTFPINLT